MSKLDRRSFLKTAATSIAVVVPASLAARSLNPAWKQPSFSGDTGMKEKVINGAGFSSTGLARMRDVMASHVTRGDMPGLVTLISQRGQTHVEAFGTPTVGSKIPMRRDTIFRIASMSKPIIAAATMILVEDGKLHLDEPLDRLLPELANRRVLKRLDGPLDDTVPAIRPITVRDLFTFCWGFGLIMGMPDDYPILKAANDLHIGMGPPSPSTTPAPDEWIRRLGSLPLMHQPGEKWMYNTGSDVLSVLLARASDQLLEIFLRERIFEPLGMKDTSFSVPATKRDRFAASYRTNFSTGAFEVCDPSDNGQWNRPPAFPSGAGGLVSTVDDYFAFGQMMLNDGKFGAKHILSSASVSVMTTDQLTPEQKAGSSLVEGYFDNHGWGFGMSVVTRPGNVPQSVGTYGWDGGLGTSWCADPKENLIGVLMTQRMWTSPSPPPVCVDFWNSAYQAIHD
jgi:CubicO group peptidase (beta-lactamase class C family)